MAVNASTTTRTLAALRVRALSPAAVLTVLVGLSFLVRLAVVWQQATPTFYPDEYIYTELARSIATHGLPQIRDGAAHFPALLVPLLTAPAWLIHDVGAAYRVVQALQALAMSLVAIPVFLLGRTLRLSTRLSLGAAAVALVVPDYMLASYVISEPFAYPLALGAVAAGVSALERPAPRTQALFLALSALAAFARMQFVVLPIAYALALVAVGLREGRLRSALREQRLPLAVLGAGGVVVAIVGVGYYNHVFSIHPLRFLNAAGANALVLAYAAGWVIVPGALMGLALALARPRERGELCFAALTVALGAGLFAQAALYGTSVHERYLFYLVPLLALAFGAYVQRGWPHRTYHALVAAGLVTAATLEPLTSLSLRGETNAPVLLAVHWLRVHLDSFGGTSMLVLWIVGAASALLVLLSRRPQVATVFAFVLAGALAAAGYGLSSDFNRRNAATVRRESLPANRSWVDARGLRRTTLLQAYGGRREDALNELFWNRSVDRVAVLPGGLAVDAFDNPSVRVAPDGTLFVRNRALRGPLLVDNWNSTLVLTGARRLSGTVGYRLWAPVGTPRLSLYLAGRWTDGWLAPEARLNAWAAKGRTIRLTVTVPRGSGTTRLRITLPQGRVMRLTLAANVRRTVSIPVCTAGAWHATMRFSASGFVGTRLVGARSGEPKLVPGARCPASFGP
ncbi:MAG: hypothetical protein ACXVZ4_00870 [Gaiellaceae bacterium]